MKLSKFKEILTNLDQLNFQLSNGEKVPAHYHVTEVGQITKKFIDCGGIIRKEERVNFQLWFSNDVDHRLEVKKMRDIITLSESKLGITDQEIEVEYQSDTIGKYALDFDGNNFVLVNTMTDCLAPDKCLVPETKVKVNLVDLMAKPNEGGCTPGGGCC
ncbi:MAG: hypothetical protein ACI8YQ_004794 [Polaribacter sp.]|jgi:hypothetical protein